MTEQKAIKWQEAFKKTYNGTPAEADEACDMAISALEEIQQYRALGTVEELKSKIEELKRWHGDHIIKEIKNEFANTSTLICHNCDHKDEYIIELEAELEELREAREKQVLKKPKTILRHRGGFEMVHCPNCNTDYQIDRRYKVNDDYCSACGKLLDSAFKSFCGNCGQAIDRLGK